MHTVKKDEVFYLVDRRAGSKGDKVEVNEITGFDALIRAAARIVNYNRQSVIWHRFREFNPFADIDFSGGDIECVCDWHGESFYREKRYMFLNKDGGVVDVRPYEKEIKKAWTERQNWLFSDHAKNWRFDGNAEDVGVRLKRYKYAKPYEDFHFRCGTVPNTGSVYHSYTSKAHISQLAKNGDFLRPKVRVSSYNLWDDRYRHTDRSWKSSYKCKHQWEKHLIRRGGKGVYVEKGEENEY